MDLNTQATLHRYLEAREEYEEQKDLLDDEVVEIFRAWFNEFSGGNYCSMEWYIQGEFIFIEVEEGCQGYYEKENYDIPISAFDDLEGTIKEKRNELDRLAEENKKKHEEAKQARELFELKRLQDKYKYAEDLYKSINKEK